jgi:hypothetical protein
MNVSAPRDPSISKLLSHAAAAVRSGEKVAALRMLAVIEDRRARASAAHGKAELRLMSMLHGLCAQLPSPWSDPGAAGLGSVGHGEDQTLPGVSVVTCCMNRSENLLSALPTWLAHERVDEVIIVDWSSQLPVAASLADAGINDRRIRIVRAVDEQRWILSFAFNLGFRLARHDAVLKLDADITLRPDFFERNSLQRNSFVAGDWTLAEKGQEHINGFFYVRRRDLLQVKGFNEYITTYGWDDDDIYSRLQQSGLERVCVDTQSIYHLPHDDALRLHSIDQPPEHALAQLISDTRFQILTNRFLANRMLPWNNERRFAPFAILADDERSLTVRRLVDELPHVVSEGMRCEAHSYAAADIVAGHLGPLVYRVPKQRLMSLLALKRLEEICAFDIALAASGKVAMSSLRRHSVVFELTEASLSAQAHTFLSSLAAAIDPQQVALFVIGGSVEARQAAVRATRGRAIAIQEPVPTEGLALQSTAGALQHVGTLAARGPGLLLHWPVGSQSSARPRHAGTPAFVQVRRRRLYVDVQHGLGNRLRAYASAAAIARRTDRELILLWTPDHHCECRFADLFNADIALIESPQDVPLSGLRRYTYMELEPGANKGELIDLESKDDVLVRSAYALNHPASQWNDENAELRALTPAAAVIELVDSVPVQGCIGAHVRMEAGKGLDHHSYDSVVNWSQQSHDTIQHWRGKSHYSAFMRRIDTLLAQRPERRLFLATDLPENYEIFRQAYGQRLQYLPRRVFDRSREQIVYALADAILLSRCEMLLGSTWSSFSELATRLSTTYSRIEMSGKDF